MNASEPSAERVERAAREMCAELKRAEPASETFDELSEEERRLALNIARAALLADAPALVEARIEGLREARDELSASAVNGESKLIRAVLELQARAIEARIAALQSALNKEPGK